VGGSLKRLNQAEALLWKGLVDETITLFEDCRKKQARNFCKYLRKHRHRIVNYDYFQAEGLCSIGSGAVESAIKQIDRRVQISGAQWNSENVPQVHSESLRLPQWANWLAKVTCSPSAHFSLDGIQFHL